MKQEYHIVAELDNSLSFRKTDVPKEFLVKPHINRLLIHATTDWLLVAVFWTAGLYISSWFYPVIALLIASRYHSFGVILHDATHMPLRKKTFAFRLLEIMAGYPIGSTINAKIYHHLRHHKDSGMHNDPYLKKRGRK